MFSQLLLEDVWQDLSADVLKGQRAVKFPSEWGAEWDHKKSFPEGPMGTRLVSCHNQDYPWSSFQSCISEFDSGGADSARLMV